MPALPAIRSDAEPASADGAVEGNIVTFTKRLAAGDEQAFRDFHDRYFQRLFRYLLAACHGNEDEAREALQETMIRVAKYVRKFDDDDVFWCWLCSVARSAANDRGRKKGRYWLLLQRYAALWIDDAPESDETEKNIQGALERCLAKLEPHDRHLLEEKYQRKISVKDLALEAGLTEKAVESRLLRLRRHLRETLLIELKKDHE